MTQAQTQQSGDSKFRLMEEEMNRFEAEIAHHQTPSLEATTVDTPVSSASVPATLTGLTFPTPQSTVMMPNAYLQSVPVAQATIPSHLFPTLAMPPVQQPMYMTPPIITYQPPAIIPTNFYGTTNSVLPSQPPLVPQQQHTSLPSIPTVATTSSNSVTVDKASTSTSAASTASETKSTASTVIVAAPQMAGPTELAARAKETAAAHSKATSAKGRPAKSVSHQAVNDADDFEVDDDVTRALLAAAAGVTYTRVQGPIGKAKIVTSTTSASLTPPVSTAVVSNATANTKSSSSNASGLPTNSHYQQHQTVLHPMLLSSSPASLAAIMSVPPPTYRAVNATTSTGTGTSSSGKKQKKFLRIAAGTVWEDPTLTDWDPNDFRIFCGDLGYEVSDDTLSRAFNRYPSFQKARVVRDKRTGKSRGYGFVSFSDPIDFTRAMREMNGKYVGNRPIKLKRSDWRIRQLETHKKKEKEKRKLGLKN